MINAKLKSAWGDESWFQKVDWLEMQKHWPAAIGEEKPGNVYSIEGPCRLTYEEVASLQAIGVELELLPLPGAMLTKMSDRHAWERDQEVDVEQLKSGAVVQIAVADLALMYIDEVDYEDDCCTDRLQTRLNDGWRILAVCPPNAARRPDYILGRRKPGG